MKVVEKSNDEEFIGQKTIEIFCGLKMKDVVKVKWSDVKSLTLHLNEIFKAKPKFQATFKIENTEFFAGDMKDLLSDELFNQEFWISVERAHTCVILILVR